jgi:hypothetical protein
MNSTDDPQAPLIPVRHSIEALSVLARSARGLPELQRIDSLLTHAIFDSLCNRGVPQTLVSDLVWPAVAALAEQATTLEIPWKPTLHLRDDQSRGSVGSGEDQGVDGARVASLR